MKLFILAQYFTVTMVLTITIGLFTLKPTVEQGATNSAQVASIAVNEQEAYIHESYK